MTWNILTNEEYILQNIILVMGDNIPTIQGQFSGVITRFKERIPYLKDLNYIKGESFVKKKEERSSS